MGSVKIVNAEKIMNMLDQLPAHLTSDAQGGVVAKSMRKGANLIRKEMKVTLQRAIDARGDESTGLLMKNLKVRRKKNHRDGERFTVGAGNKRYPGRKGERGGTTRLSAQRLEYGTSKQAPMPWIRPAFDKTAAPAIRAITEDLERRLDVIAATYLKG